MFSSFYDYKLGILVYRIIRKTIDIAEDEYERFSHIILKKPFNDLGVRGCMKIADKYKGSTFVVRNLVGSIAPFTEFYKPRLMSFVDMADDIHGKISKGGDDFAALNTSEFFGYGGSLESIVNEGIQVIQMTEKEEANSIPLIMTQKIWKKMYREYFSESITKDFIITGAVTSIDSDLIRYIIGEEYQNKLKKTGHISVLIPDEELIDKFKISMGHTKPAMALLNNTTTYLCQVWVMYKNKDAGESIPIYVYGNIGKKDSYDKLCEKLVYEVEYFKKVIWNESRNPKDRKYKLIGALNKDILTKISKRFGDEVSNEIDIEFLLRSEPLRVNSL